MCAGLNVVPDVRRPLIAVINRRPLLAGSATPHLSKLSAESVPLAGTIKRISQGTLKYVAAHNVPEIQPPP
jgi:hypothetical protein